MRVMAVDPGSKRVGLAMSDPTGTIAQALRLDGTHGPEAAAARRLAHSLRQVSGLPVEMVDERLTTAAAERSLIAGGVRRAKRRLTVDRVAATILLQGHLDAGRARGA